MKMWVIFVIPLVLLTACIHFLGEEDGIPFDLPEPSVRYIISVEDENFFVIEISDPTFPFECGYYRNDSFIYDICASGTFVYMSDEEGVKVVDVSDPYAPNLVSEIGEIGAFSRMSIEGNRIYAFSRDASQLVVMDVSDPSSPSVLASVQVNGWSVHIDGSRIYVLLNHRISIFDDSIPPVHLATHELSVDIGRACVSNSYLYIVTFDNKFLVMDLSDPQKPVEKARMKLPPEIYCLCMSAVDDHVYILSWEYIIVVDVSNPSRPRITDKVDVMGLSADNFYIAPPYLYLAGGFEGLHIYYITDSGKLKKVGAVRVEEIRGVDIADGRLFITAYYPLLLIMDILDSGKLVQLGAIRKESLNFFDYAQDVYVSQDTAYLTEGKLLRIIDVEDPEKPVIEEEINVNGVINDLIVEYPHCYMANDFEGLNVINVGEPIIYRVGGIETYKAYGIALKDPYAYIADGGNGLVIIDISNPFRSQMVKRLDVEGYCRDVDIHVVNDRSYALVANGDMVVVDVTDVQNPRIICDFELEGEVFRIETWDQYAYVLSSEGLYILDISNVSSPSIMVADLCYADDIALTQVGENKYMACSSGSRVFLYNVNDSTSPRLVSWLHMLYSDIVYGVKGR